MVYVRTSAHRGDHLWPVILVYGAQSVSCLRPRVLQLRPTTLTHTHVSHPKGKRDTIVVVDRGAENSMSLCVCF